MEPPIINSLTKEISTFPSVEKIILYGSRARGDHEERSDIDLAVVCPSATEEEWLKIWQRGNEADTLYFVDLVQFEKADKPLQESIIREGKVLYEHRPSPVGEKTDGKRVAEILQEIADSGGIGIENPQEWQREIRKDCSLQDELAELRENPLPLPKGSLLPDQADALINEVRNGRNTNL